MDNQHSDVAAELWSLAETVLTRLEPLLRQAVQEQSERPRQGCSWCPVCALAALLRGEQHELLTLVTSEGASVIALIRQIVAEHVDPASQPSAAQSEDRPDGATHADEPTVAREPDESMIRRPAFEPITVTVKDSTTSDSQD